MTEDSSNRENAKIFWLAGGVLLLKLILLPFVQNTDADAVLRVFGAQEWKEHPVWISSGVWGPFHFYLNGIALMIWNNTIYAPVILNVLLSTFTLFPFYYFTRREFNEKGAFISTIFLAICPILFRISFLPLSETPYLLFIVLTMNFISKGLREERIIIYLLAGFCLTLASGFRYEAWLLIILFGVMIVLTGKWKEAFLFGSVALIFPLIWLVQNYSTTSNALFSFQLAFDAMNNKEDLHFVSYLRRTWFFPFSWMIALGPPAAWITIRIIFGSYIKVNRNLYRIIWTIPLFGVYLFFYYNALKGSLLLQHRFTGTLVVLSLPYFALYFKEISKKKTKNAFLFVIATIGLSFAWNTYGVKPLPRLKDQSGDKVSKLIENKIEKNSALIVDFWNWENTYYIAHRSKLPLNNIAIIFGTKNSDIQKERIQHLLNDHPGGVILLKKNSPLFNDAIIKGDQLRFKWYDGSLEFSELFQNNEVFVYSYLHAGKSLN